MKMLRKSSIGQLVLCFVFAATVAAQDVTHVPPPTVPTGKTPIIIIPGITGSNLVNSKTDEVVWFKASRSKDDDIRLPISSVLSRNRDNLVPKDIIREIKLLKFLPEIEIYERLANSLETKGGYTEGKWDAPGENGDRDTYYVFPYDWRRDNVENARLLVTKVEALKRKLGKRNLKFNIIAHSMGGLITRYAAMYGNADIPAGPPKPTWAGARNFDKVFLLGTPNEGSVSTMNALLNGFSYIGGINLPFIQDISRFDAFTIPSIYQLLPHEGTLLAYDENLKPLEIDIYDPATWETYQWGIWKDDDYLKKFTAAEVLNVDAYFKAVLSRAKRFQAALNANTNVKPPVSFYLMGGDCKDTLDGMLLLRNVKKDRWETHFKPDSFTRSTGEKITGVELKKLLFSVGDSTVTKRSLEAKGVTKITNRPVLPIVSELYQCELHSKLVTNPEIQDRLFVLINSAAAP
jgi:pimeloyl-ACP methyl ester carboxylesterase